MTGPEETDRVDAARERLQRWAAALLVAVVPWLIAPGMLQPDTKTALVLSPQRYLERALWAWSDHTGVGELQNQAYGYLWPMGPVFLAGDVVGMPGWAVQRLWWMLVLVVAFAGAERVARRLGGLPTVPALVTAAVFALSPRVLTVLAEISVEVWPSAVAPWLLLAAARAVAPGARAGDRRRAAVATGLLTACLGGVNATVSLVALVPAAAWLVLAPAGRARWRSLAWWCGGALLGGLWWLGPLLVLGRYAYPFLDHIEVASTTTAVASVVNVLRGANHWIAYILTSGDHPTWQSGWVLAQAVPAVIATSTLAGLGLAGLVRRRAEAQESVPAGPGAPADSDASTEGRHLTRWALAMTLVGAVVMAVGRSGSASGPLAEVVQGWLDGPLAPFRNVHKADLLIRLPIALGVGLLAHWATRIVRGAGPVARQVVVVTLVLALSGSMAPLWVGRVGDAWATEAVPEEWHEMAERVDDAAARHGGTTLVLPGVRTAHFTWGRVTDEPLRSLAASPVLARAAAPLGPPGATRILDHLDELTSTGRGQVWLAEGLRRLGVSRVVVRGGIHPDVTTEDPERVADTFAASPGLSRTWSTGEGSQRISLWRVDDPGAPATLVPRDGAVPVSASPEGWFDLVGAGVLDPHAVTTLTEGSRAAVRSDTLRWQVLNSGRPAARGHGPTVPAGDSRPSVVGSRDLAPGGEPVGRTTRTYAGLSGITVSSSAADPFAPHWRSAEAGPASLVDGDSRTAWVSGDGSARQRITLRLEEPASPSAVLVHEARGGDLGELEGVSVDGREGVREPGSLTWRIPLEDRDRETITIELQGTGDDPVAIGVREVGLENGPDLGTALATPTGDGPVVLTRDPRGADDLDEGEDPADLVRRVGPMPDSSVRARVRIRPGAAGQELLAAPWSLAGSTRPDPERSGRGITDWPLAALDGDPATGWTPMSGASRPVLDIDFGSPQHLERITLNRPVGSVEVTTDHGTYEASGRRITIPAQETGRLRLTFTRPPDRAAWTAPEVSLQGVDGLGEPGQRVSLECSAAGSVGRHDSDVGLALDADLTALMAGRVVPATACGSLPAGEGTVTAGAVPGLVPERVTLAPEGWTPTDVAARGLAGHREHSGRWTFGVDASEESLLVLKQGANDGWVATTEDGTELEKVTVDGWRQAFVVPEGTSGEVLVDFAPNRWHRLALALGAIAAGLLLAWGLVELVARRRRRREEGPAGESVQEEPHEGRRSATTGLLVSSLGAGVVGLLVAGWLGLLTAVAGSLVPVRRRGLVVALVLGGAGLALAVLGTAERHSAGAWVSQGLGALSLGVLVSALAWPGGDGPGQGPDAPPPSTTGGPDPR